MKLSTIVFTMCFSLFANFIFFSDFHDFQINLLQEYPLEAGKADRERILPYMPGPLSSVDEEITGTFFGISLTELRERKVLIIIF